MRDGSSIINQRRMKKSDCEVWLKKSCHRCYLFKLRVSWL